MKINTSPLWSKLNIEDEAYGLAEQKLTSLRFEAQKAIILKVVDTIIADQEMLRVRGALYLSI